MSIVLAKFLGAIDLERTTAETGKCTCGHSASDHTKRGCWHMRIENGRDKFCPCPSFTPRPVSEGERP